MRAFFLFLIAGVVALGAMLAACGGDEEQQVQQDQQTQEQTEQDRRTEQSAAGERSSGEERSESAAAAAEQSEPQVDAEAQQGGDGAARDPLFAEAEAAYRAWSENLQTFVLDADIEVNFGGLETQVQMTIWMQVEPLMILMSIDGSVLAEMDGGQSEQAAEPLLMQILISEESAYLSMPELGGWVDASEDFDELLGGLTGLLGVAPEDFADLDGLGQAFGCVEVVGGAISVERYAGEPVWMIDCEIDVEALNEASAQALAAMDLEVVDSGIESMHLRMAISQATGAPLLIESRMTLADPFGLMGGDADDSGEEAESYVSQAATLRSWNEPIEFPKPEPLVDGSLLDALVEPGDDEFSDGDASSGEPPELLSAAELVELAADWMAGVDELQMEFAVWATIDGEQRRASTLMRSSRSRGAFETSVTIDESSGFRLLWTRDGIWTSEADVDGGPAWTPSDPALLGFAGQSVDQFLAEPAWLDPEPLRALLELAWLSRTIEGGGPPVYELVIEGGPFEPGDAHFERIAETLKADTAELLAASVTVTSIGHYSTSVTIVGDEGAIVRQATSAEFESSAGWVALEAVAEVSVDGPIEFSQPPR